MLDYTLIYKHTYIICNKCRQYHNALLYVITIIEIYTENIQTIKVLKHIYTKLQHTFLNFYKYYIIYIIDIIYIYLLK